MGVSVHAVPLHLCSAPVVVAAGPVADSVPVDRDNPVPSARLATVPLASRPAILVGVTVLVVWILNAFFDTISVLSKSI